MTEHKGSDQDIELFCGSLNELLSVMGIRDTQRRLKAYPNMAMTLLGELLIYGRTRNSNMIGGLRMFYEAVAREWPERDREQLYQFVVERAESRWASPNALIPFIGSEPWGPLASRAVIDFCMFVALAGEPPEEGIRAVGDMLKRPGLANRGAVFGGLLCLGDRRAHAELLEIRDQLEPEEVDQAVRVRTGFLSAATIEFYMDWMEERLEFSDERIFGALAAGMYNQIKAARVPAVMTGQRAIPPGALPPEVEERQEAWVPLRDYAQQISPRLHALHEAETEPKLMPEVLEAWGLLEEG